ncbi:hypothetical protein [Pedobacter antarcticus]|uniref:Uncharacterized protein n=1 Tax=Pedobacter antarcticus TaxID=34086 RepID=A0A1I2GEM4_9SPHI|nr:hypothetical protein [Pedobacter antarcticus]SDM14218.1 hypothetical protein SAMN04488084_10442 [Pedobacter antarcticus]SFF15081.1 hypothetical protein SAMN03003324_02648 [Pedobacter antarcticus]
MNALKYVVMITSSGKYDLVRTSIAGVFKGSNNWSKEYIWLMHVSPVPVAPR